MNRREILEGKPPVVFYSSATHGKLGNSAQSDKTLNVCLCTSRSDGVT